MTRHKMRNFCPLTFTLMLTIWISPRIVHGQVFYVSPSGSDANTGAIGSPWLTIQNGLNAIQAGDTLMIADGTYNESLDTIRNGTAGNRITVRAQNPGGVTVTTSGRVLDMRNSYNTFEGMRFDGQFGTSDVVRVFTGGDFGTLSGVEILNGSRDGIDLGDNKESSAPSDFLEGFSIRDSRIYNMLGMSGGSRIDAHGIVAGAVRNFVIANTEVNYVSGDALQLQNGDWDEVLVDSVKFWNGPLPVATNGYSAGVNPGENAIDTKQDPRLPTRGRLQVQDSEFFGWAGSLISNSAAFVLKEKVDVTIERSLFYDNNIALRLRGETASNDGAFVSVKNSIFYDNAKAARLEDDVANLELLNNTFGEGNSTLIQSVAGGAEEATLSVLNNLFLQPKPPEAADASNLVVDASGFMSVNDNNYRLVAGSLAIDTGLSLANVIDDFDGVSRPVGAAHDIGAFEFVSEAQQLGDFDDDGDVDGSDFLKWQRGGSPDQLSASDLDDWITNFGEIAQVITTSTTVPEPSSVCLAFGGWAIAFAFRTSRVQSLKPSRQRCTEGGS